MLLSTTRPIIKWTGVLSHRCLPCLYTTTAAARTDTSSDKTNKFHDLVEKGDIEGVREAINSTTTDIVNQGDPGRANTTPLHLASRRGFIDLVEFLVGQGADLNARGAWDLTPLHYSAVFNQPTITTKLLDYGADHHLKDAKGNTALDHAKLERNNDVVTILENVAK
jgi:ankyrin repeat protein